MRPLHPILALALCLVLALTSQSLAVARGMAQPVGKIVLCTGTGPITVAVDAEGQPRATPHLCPDCLPGFAVVLDAPLALGLWLASERRISTITVERHAAMRSLPPNVARAPPVAV
ncbi:hypothetical protein RTM1035_11938 [Roseovarius sp. TM1035]|jgi:hypothetical protein|uniref:hypothetical protein n=1 Tax=Roseovarius sp. TM1035 TaxID=391613 RepID=UPI000155731C|nr:hypothetical protein [Roseovarius sp. TM1035]EDM32162.1 hypothetical protein RTM1035_11938 [Roseovarius sp. TM1035]